MTTANQAQAVSARPAEGQKPYFPALDGIRAYCVLLVMYNHLKSDGHSVSWLEGHLGVDLFFLLSGFLITSLMLLEHRTNAGRVDLRAFYWRRFFRIVPVYSAVLLLYVLVCQLPSQASHWIQLRAGLPWFLTFMNEYVREPNNGSVFTHTWSLGVEEKFYLFFPALLLLFLRIAKLRGIFICITLVLVVAAPLSTPGLFWAYFGLMTGGCMAVLLAGPDADRVRRFAARTPWPVVAGLFLAGFPLVHWDGRLLVAFYGFSALLMMHMMAAPDGVLSHVHSVAWLRWFGKRSYSMYLIHVLCLNLLEARLKAHNGWEVVAMLLVAYGVTAIGAELLYRAVEEPARNYGRRFIARRTSARERVSHTFAPETLPGA